MNFYNENVSVYLKEKKGPKTFLQLADGHIISFSFQVMRSLKEKNVQWCLIKEDFMDMQVFLLNCGLMHV